MPSLTTPRELRKWVPGKVLSASDALGWKDVGQRTYCYSGLRFTSGARAPHLAGIERPSCSTNCPVRSRHPSPWCLTFPNCAVQILRASLDYASSFRPAPSAPLPLG